MPASTEAAVVRLSRGEVIELRNRDYRAVIAPAAGGRIASLAWTGGLAPCDLLVPWNGEGFDEHAWPKAGAFPMLPFANRLPREGFRFGDRLVQAHAAPAGFALHGTAHRKRWSVIEAGPRHAQLRLVHEAGDEGWPWAWTAEQDIHLGAGGLHVTLRLRNDASESMPMGMGWHPYHPTSASFSAEHLYLAAQARRELDAEGMTSAEERAPDWVMQPGQTSVFRGWDGGVRIRSESTGSIVTRIEGASCLVLHRPFSEDYLCAEPVTLLPGQLGQDAEEGGTGVLPPGQVRALSWSCGYEDDRATPGGS